MAMTNYYKDVVNYIKEYNPETEDDVLELIFEYIDTYVIRNSVGIDICDWIPAWNGWKSLEMLDGETPDGICDIARAALYEYLTNDVYKNLIKDVFENK